MNRLSWRAFLYLLAYVLQGVAVLLLCLVVALWALRGLGTPIPQVVPDAALEPLSVILAAVATFAAGRVAAWGSAQLLATEPTPRPDPPKPIPLSQTQPSIPQQGGSMSLPPYSCFVSYSSQDDAFAQHLVARLRAAGLNVWFASNDIKAGEKLYDQIREAIRRQDKLLIVLSVHSLESEWVETELRLARRQEIASGKRKLFPIRVVDMATLRSWECFDADEGRDLAVEVREYFIPDFSNWKDHDAFESTFAKLLRDLRTEAGGRPPNATQAR